MGMKELVEELRKAELDEEAEEQGDVIDAFVGQFQGGVHGVAPTKAGGKASLYRGGGGGEKTFIKYMST